MNVRIATRKSALALWQAEHVAKLLGTLPEIDAVELLPLSTRGDEVLDRSLQKVGGKGLFIKELEIAMEDGRADLAVHSMKDVPAEMPSGFSIAAVLERANPFDALVSVSVRRLADLPEGARVGSSSLRRQAQLLALRPDLKIEPLRGNVNTRLAKLDTGHYDAIILACAGLERLGMSDRISHELGPREMLPAAAQGVIGIECRSERHDLMRALAEIDDDTTRQTTVAERAVARRLEASCQSPIASYATVDGDALTLQSLVAKPDGSELLREQMCGDPADADALGVALAERMLDRGAAELLGEATA